MNFYTIYFDLNWAEFQILELFDIINLIFGIILIIFGFYLFMQNKINKSLLYFGGILFFLFNIINPSHFLMFLSLISLMIGIPPVWMSVIPENLLIIYLSSWSILSISNITLQFIGFYVAVRIIRNSNPQKALIQFLYFYCWVIGLSGIILCIQSTIVLSLTASWASITIAPYILHFSTWILMSIIGISGIIFIKQWIKNQVQSKDLKFGQITLISFGIMHILISFSDFAMKSIPILAFNVIFAGLLIIFAFKIPVYFEEIEK